MLLTINPTFADRVVVHNRCSKPIGEQSASELKDLAIIARSSNNPLLLECFIDLPSLEELKADKTMAEIATAKNGEPTKIKHYNTDDISVPSITAPHTDVE